MAVQEFFIRLAQDYATRSAGTKLKEAATLFEQAAGLSLKGDMEGATGLGQQAQGLLSDAHTASANSEKVMSEIVPEVLSRLEALGIPEPSVDFLTPVPHEVRPPKKHQPRRPKRTKESGPGRPISPDLTEPQMLCARATFRLLDDSAVAEVSVAEAIKAVFPPEQVSTLAPKILMGRVNGNWPGTEEKIRRGWWRMKEGEEDELRFPLTEEQLNRLADSPTMQDIFRRASAVEAYQDMTLQQIIKYTQSTVKSIPLRRAQEGADYTQFAAEDIQHLIKSILGDQTLSVAEGDRVYLSRSLTGEPEDQTSPDETEGIKQRLIKIMERYYTSRDSKRQAFIDQQSEVGQVLLGFIHSQWSSSQEFKDWLAAKADLGVL